ncbi:Rv3654c family TadE-like protein [Corynebacterium choanae]|uniref:Putative Flp pilus-assembly TadG-like N-terminal domain-containing protein n=1 Tax=Corynebacterium choanae TaxID=1862358 RepID=A0A3G6J976_9CORY|nr:Rv3654c family TadE-like protein [Corynebacterium choanae]AZA14546.1 hypothetical protein CCHOA_10840 [Corynebacterium choanae]
MDPITTSRHLRRKYYCIPRFLHRQAFPDEQGSATVATVGMIAVLVVTALLLLHAAHNRIVHHQLQVAADCAALSAATAPWWDADACAVAAQIATAHHATLVDCELDDGMNATVTVRSGGQLLKSRAGPAALATGQ